MGRLSDWIYDVSARGRLNLLRLPQAPPLDLDDSTRRGFDALLEATPSGGWVEYHGERPKPEFLRYLAEERGFLMHGSNDPEIPEFTPRPQHTYTGDPVEAVFATTDGSARSKERSPRLWSADHFVTSSTISSSTLTGRSRDQAD